MAGVELATGYVSLVPSADGFGAALSGQISGPVSAVGAQASSGFGASFAKGIAAAGAIGIAAAGAVGVGLFKIGESFDDAYDTIRTKTGAIGPELDGLEQSFKRVVSSVPTDFATASEAVALLNQRLGSTGGLVEAQATQFLNLSRITKTDLAANIEDVTRLYGDWGITVDDQAERLDQLFRASQESGVALGTLAQQAVQFGAPLRGMGFNLDESVGLLAAFNKAGVNTELVMGSLRIALGKFARDGVTDTKAALLDLFEQIKQAPSQGEAAAIAMETFGARAGADMADTIRGGKFEVAELLDTISNGKDTINTAAADTADFGEKWQVIKNRIFVGLEPLAARVFDALGAGMDAMGPLADRALATFEDLSASFNEGGDTAAALVEVWASLQAAGREVFTDLAVFVAENRATFEEWGERIQSILTSAGRIMAEVLEAAQMLWRTFGDTVLTYVVGSFSAVLTVVDGALKAIEGVFDVVLGVLTGDWTRAWDGIKNIVAGVWQVIWGVVEGALNTLRGIISTPLAAIGVEFEDVWNDITGFVTGAMDWVKAVVIGGVTLIGDTWRTVWGGVGDFFGGIWDGIKAAAAAGVNWVIDHVLNPFIGVLNTAIDLYNKLPFFDNIDKLPELDRIGTPDPTRPPPVAGDDIRQQLTASVQPATTTVFAPPAVSGDKARTAGVVVEHMEVKPVQMNPSAYDIADAIDRKLGWRAGLAGRPA